MKKAVLIVLGVLVMVALLFVIIKVIPQVKYFDQEEIYVKSTAEQLSLSVDPSNSLMQKIFPPARADQYPGVDFIAKSPDLLLQVVAMTTSAGADLFTKKNVDIAKLSGATVTSVEDKYDAHYIFQKLAGSDDMATEDIYGEWILDGTVTIECTAYEELETAKDKVQAALDVYFSNRS